MICNISQTKVWAKLKKFWAFFRAINNKFSLSFYLVKVNFCYYSIFKIVHKLCNITDTSGGDFWSIACHCIFDPVIENTNFCKYSKAFIVKATLRSKIPAEYTLQFTITINRGTLKNFAWMLISKTSHRMCYHIIISITTCFWVDGFWVNVSRARRNQACWIMIYTVDWETNRLDVVIQCCRLVKSC